MPGSIVAGVAGQFYLKDKSGTPVDQLLIEFAMIFGIGHTTVVNTNMIPFGQAVEKRIEALVIVKLLKPFNNLPFATHHVSRRQG